MWIVALKECPQGQLPGTVFEVPDAAGRVLILAGAAREATEQDRGLEAPRRGYRRRDLRARE